MSTILTVAGFIVWVVFACALITGMVYSLLVVLEKLIDRRERLVRADERRECGSRLLAAAWWFSEDMTVTKLLQEAGQNMLQGLDPLGDTSAVRERWRTSRKLSVVPQTQEP